QRTLPDVPAAKQRGGNDDDPDADERRPKVARLAPFAFHAVRRILSRNDQVLHYLEQIEPGVTEDGGYGRTAAEIHDSPAGTEKAGGDRGVRPLRVEVTCAKSHARHDEPYRGAAQPRLEPMQQKCTLQLLAHAA